MPKISVILSTFNNEQTIENAVCSILDQSFKNFELLICDDASNDSTIEKLNYLAKSDNRIKLISNSYNIGLTKSLNKLIKLSKSNLIARQDADDISLPERFEKQINFLKHNMLDACSTRALTIPGNKKIPGFSYFIPVNITILFKNPFVHGSLLIKKNILNSVNNYDERFVYAQDYKLMHDLIVKNYKLGILKEPLYQLNTKNNISTNKKKEQAYFANCVRKNIVPESI